MPKLKKGVRYGEVFDIKRRFLACPYQYWEDCPHCVSDPDDYTKDGKCPGIGTIGTSSIESSFFDLLKIKRYCIVEIKGKVPKECYAVGAIPLELNGVFRQVK